MSAIEIIALQPEMHAAIQQAARLLTVAFGNWPGAWATIDEGLEEVREMLAPDRVIRVALDGPTVVGWVGGIPGYRGRVWELHPLVVAPERQRQGIGTLLVRDLERVVAARGALTITLGTDDEDDMTSLAGADLYVDTWAQIRDIRNLKGHPYEFYQKLGFTIVGVVPDANGRGKPDILMGKRVGG